MTSYRDKTSGTTLGERAAGEERLSIPGPIPPFWPPWPWPLPWDIILMGSGERSDQNGAPSQADMVPVLEALYLRPDVRAATIQATQAFTELLSRDEEAARAFNEFIVEPATRDQGEERLAPLAWLAICAAVGLGAGILSRP